MSCRPHSAQHQARYLKYQRRNVVCKLNWQTLRRVVLLSLSLSTSDWNGIIHSTEGASLTPNGYDYPIGENPVCWKGQASLDTANSKRSFVNPFEIVNNTYPATPVLLQSCPNGTQITARLSGNQKTLGLLPDGTWMGETDVMYHYEVQGTIDLSRWNPNIVSPLNDNMKIQVSMILCSIEQVRFCTPFLHYETNQQEGMLGSLHGGSHIDTAVYQVPLIDSSFSASISLQVKEPGAFSIVVGALFLVLANDTTSTNKTNQVLFAGQVADFASDFPVIAFWNVQVSSPARLAAFILIACSGAFILLMLLSTIRHRKAQVMKLTQGNLLIDLLVSALIATLSSVTFEPKNSNYCNLQGPLIILPLHVMFAILVGRLWRIQAVVSPLLLLTLERQDTWSDKFVQWMRRITDIGPSCKDSGSENQNGSIMNSIRASWMKSMWKRRGAKDQSNPTQTTSRAIRCKVSEAQLLRVIAIFCFPQIVVQVLYLVFARERVVNGLCPADFFDSATDGFGGVLLLLIVLFLLALARSAKDLPSLFNETEALWDVSLVSLVLLGVAFVVTVVTHSPTTKPDIRYIVGTLTVVAITTNTCLKIIVPKLIKIWHNEMVVVTKLISDHNRKERSPLTVVVESSGEVELDEEQDEAADRPYRSGSTRMPSNAQAHGSGYISSMPDEDTDREGHESDDSSVVLICHEETEFGRKSASNVQTNTIETNSTFRHESLDSKKTHDISDTHSDSVNETNITQSFRRNSYGLPSRSSLLSSSSYNIPENASVPTTLYERFPSSYGSVIGSDPPSTRRTIRASRMNPRVAHASIVTKRTRMSSRRPTHGSFVSQNSSSNTTSEATGTKGLGFSIRLPKNKDMKLLDIAYNPKLKKQSICIVLGNPDEPPPRRLLLRMIDVHHSLGLVNRAILSGGLVTQEDWEFLRESIVALGKVFEEDVNFEWESLGENHSTQDVPGSQSQQAATVTRGSIQSSKSYSEKRPAMPVVGVSTSPLWRSKAAGLSVPFTGDFDAAVVNGRLQHFFRSNSRQGSLRRAASDPSKYESSQFEPRTPPDSGQQTNSPIRRQSRALIPLTVASHNAIMEDDDEYQTEGEEFEDERSSVVRHRVLPRSGRSFPRSRFRASLSTSLQTIQSAVTESTTSESSGLASSRLYRSSGNLETTVSSPSLFSHAAATASRVAEAPPTSESGPPTTLGAQVVPPKSPPDSESSTGSAVPQVLTVSVETGEGVDDEDVSPSTTGF